MTEIKWQQLLSSFSSCYNCREQLIHSSVITSPGIMWLGKGLSWSALSGLGLMFWASSVSGLFSSLSLFALDHPFLSSVPSALPLLLLISLPGSNLLRCFPSCLAPLVPTIWTVGMLHLRSTLCFRALLASIHDISSMFVIFLYECRKGV